MPPQMPPQAPQPSRHRLSIYLSGEGAKGASVRAEICAAMGSGHTPSSSCWGITQQPQTRAMRSGPRVCQVGSSGGNGKQIVIVLHFTSPSKRQPWPPPAVPMVSAITRGLYIMQSNQCRVDHCVTRLESLCKRSASITCSSLSWCGAAGVGGEVLPIGSGYHQHLHLMTNTATKSNITLSPSLSISPPFSKTHTSNENCPTVRQQLSHALSRLPLGPAVARQVEILERRQRPQLLRGHEPRQRVGMKVQQL